MGGIRGECGFFNTDDLMDLLTEEEIRDEDDRKLLDKVLMIITHDDLQDNPILMALLLKQYSFYHPKKQTSRIAGRVAGFASAFLRKVAINKIARHNQDFNRGDIVYTGLSHKDVVDNRNSSLEAYCMTDERPPDVLSKNHKIYTERWGKENNLYKEYIDPDSYIFYDYDNNDKARLLSRDKYIDHDFDKEFPLYEDFVYVNPENLHRSEFRYPLPLFMQEDRYDYIE